MMINQLPAPMPDQCLSGEIIEHNGKRYLATWYPQMVGHSGMCLVDVSSSNECFDVAVWHDGEFPFDAAYQPTLLHHCDAAQFIRFGEMVQKAKGEPR